MRGQSRRDLVEHPAGQDCQSKRRTGDTAPSIKLDAVSRSSSRPGDHPAELLGDRKDMPPRRRGADRARHTDTPAHRHTAIEHYIRANTRASYHARGTAHMGVDDSTVVDLRVHGVLGLRAIDCSISDTRVMAAPSGAGAGVSPDAGTNRPSRCQSDRARLPARSACPARRRPLGAAS